MSDVLAKMSPSRRRFLATMSIIAGLFLALLAAEVLLRLVPVPGIELNTAVYDDITGSGLYPGSELSYRSDTGDLVRRHINDIGYPDRDHDKETAGAFRIGFFGDSYTEARQVVLEDTFFRLIEDRLDDVPVETLAFGVTGFSMFQSYLTYQKWVEHFDLDMAVYVFVENDLGDQMKSVRRTDARPYPILTENGLVADNSFRERYRQRNNRLRRLGDRLTAHSLVFATLALRIRLLQRHGIKMRVTHEDRAMTTRVPEGDERQRIPDQNDNPSVWPTELRNEAAQLGEAVLDAWARDAAEKNVAFAIATIPRELEMPKPALEQDSWKPWLETYCRDSGIPTIDPSAELLSMKAAGHQVFHDHFTPDGHVALANAFVEWFRGR